MASKLWFEGKKNFTIIMTEEDLKFLVLVLEEGSHGVMSEEKSRVKDRILFQIRDQL